MTDVLRLSNLHQSEQVNFVVILYELIPMTRIYFLLAIHFILYKSFAQSQSDEQKIIMELEKERQHAIAMRDEAKLKELLDDAYYGVTATGQLANKNEQLAIYKSTNSFITNTPENVSVTIVDNSAVVTGTMISKAKSGAIVGQTRFLYVYIKHGNQWKIKMGQETIVMKD